MIDTERASVDVKNSLRRAHFYIKHLKLKGGMISREEKQLAKSINYDLEMITREAREMLSQTKRRNYGLS